MTRCVIYARYSSDLQSPTSIDDQIALCRAVAERRGPAAVGTFHDAAISGFAAENRPGYRELLRAALASPPAFDTILVEDVSSLTRDTAELLRLNQRLTVKGVELIGVSDGIATAGHGSKGISPSRAW